MKNHNLWYIIGGLLLVICESRIPVWIDTDPSVGNGEVDDGLALIQALQSPELDIKGISIVYGNAELDDCYNIATQLVSAFSDRPIPVYRGAASAEDTGGTNSAAVALASQLKRSQLVIIALGPLTNIANSLKFSPIVASNILKLVAVAGRRAGQEFRVGNMTSSFPDLNFEKDAQSAKYVIDVLSLNNVEVVLTPWEVSSKVWVRRDHLAMLKNTICPTLSESHLNNPLTYDNAVLACSECSTISTSAIRCANLLWVLDKCLFWASMWERSFGTEGFNPFDTLAVGYVLHPELFSCDRVLPEFKFMDTENRAPIEPEIIENLVVHLSNSAPPPGQVASAEVCTSSSDENDGHESISCSNSVQHVGPPSDPKFILINALTAGDTASILYCSTVDVSFIELLYSRLLGQ